MGKERKQLVEQNQVLKTHHNESARPQSVKSREPEGGSQVKLEGFLEETDGRA